MAKSEGPPSALDCNDITSSRSSSLGPSWEDSVERVEMNAGEKVDGSRRYYESSCSSEQVIIILQLVSCNQQLSTFALTSSYALYKRVYIGNIVVIVNSSSLKLLFSAH